MEGGGRDQDQGEGEHNYSRQEEVDGSASSICSFRSKHSKWSAHTVKNTRALRFPNSFLIVYSKPSNNGCEQHFEAFLFWADDQRCLDMFHFKIDNKEKQKGLSQALGKREAGGNLEFTFIIQTRVKNELQVKIGDESQRHMVGVPADDLDDHKQEFWVETSEELCFTEEKLKFPNNTLKNVTIPELKRMKLANLSQPFSFRIVWRNPELAQTKVNVVIEVIAYDHDGESEKTRVIYPVQFNNFGRHSFAPKDERKNRRAVKQLRMNFADANTLLEEIDNIIEFLSDGKQLTPEDVQNLSKSKEKAGELLHHVIKHEEVMPFFLNALRSTGNPQNIKLVELIMNPKPEA